MHARQLIRTKYHGPTNTRESRVSARAEAGRVTLPWDDAGDVGENHTAAAYALACKYSWLGHYVAGADKDGYTFVWCGRPENEKPCNCAFTVTPKECAP